MVVMAVMVVAMMMAVVVMAMMAVMAVAAVPMATVPAVATMMAAVPAPTRERRAVDRQRGSAQGENCNRCNNDFPDPGHGVISRSVQRDYRLL